MTDELSSTTGGSPAPSESMPKNLAAAATYLLGFITGIVFLVLEKKDSFVRFHAMQSTITFGAIFVIQIVFSRIGPVGWMIDQFLTPATLILWIILMFKAFTGERFKLPYIGDLAEQQLGKL